MNLKKPKFWDYNKPNIFAYFLYPVAILIKLLNLDRKSISAVYEKPGALKIGHYVPGTNIPIQSDEKMLDMSPPVILNLAWHISKEIKDYLVGQGFNGEIIDIYSPNIEV